MICVPGENSEYPYDPESDGSNDRQDHGDTGAAHSAQCSRKQIHLAAEEIGNCGIGKNLHSALDNLRVFRIDLQELRTEKVCTTAHGKGYGKGQDHTVNKHPVHTFRFSHTINSDW